MSKIVRANFEQSEKNTFFDKKLLINFFWAPGGHGVNTEVVDIDKIYLNMQYETDPIAQF